LIVQMSLTPLQKRRCLQAMDDLDKFYISRLFSHPVDPARDNCPNYFDVIHSPMDLGTARSKLESDQYSTVDQWRADMELVWNNTLTFNGTKSLLADIAKQLQTHFREIAAFLSSDVEGDWAAKFEKLKGELQAIVRSSPKAAPPSRASRPPLTTRSSAPPPPPAPPPSAGGGVLSPHEISALSVEVNLIENPEEVDQILALIQSLEPSHAPPDEDGELDLAALQPATLLELRALVRKLLGRE
jgi:hypothetical protein